MSNRILLKRRSTAGAPLASALEYGELALNYGTDATTGLRIYFKDSDDVIRSITVADQTEVRLDNILGATSSNTIGNGNHQQRWNWQLTGSTPGFHIAEATGSASSGTGTLFLVETVTGSVADPFRVRRIGTDVLHVKATGAFDVVTPASQPVQILSGGALQLEANNSGAVQIVGGDGTLPGLVDIIGGAASGGSKGGTVQITAGTSASGEGGNVAVVTTPGTLGGDFNVTTGAGSSGRGGNVHFTTGNSTSALGGRFEIDLGSGTGGHGVFDIQQGGTSRLTVDANGQVGISTVSPTEALHVSGNIRLSGHVQFTDGNIVGSTLDGLSDTSVASAPALSVLQRNAAGTAWVATARTALLSLDDITDVDISGLATSHVLRWDGSSWKNAALVIADVTSLQTALDDKLNLSGGTMTGLLTLSGAPTAANHAATKQYVDSATATVSSNLTTHISDLTLHLTAAQNTFLDSINYTDVNGLKLTGDVLSWNGTEWVASAPVTNLNGLSDVIITAPVAPNVLRYNGTDWVNQTLVAADISNFATAVNSAVTIGPGGVQGYDADLTALAGLASTGIIVRTGAGTAVTRQINGTAGRVVVTDGDGVLNNPTIDLATSGVTAGTYAGITLDVYGRATAATALTTLSGYGITDAVNKGGDTMTGFLTLHADPTADLHAATKGYVDAVAQGLKVKAAVRAATTGDITLSGPQTIDGVSVVAGQRVLVRAQTDPTQNGIYVVNAGAWTRATDADTGAELVSAFVFVEAGTTYADSGFVQTTDSPITIGTSNIVWTQFSGAGAYIAGAGLLLTGNTFSVNVTNVTTGIVGDDVVVRSTGTAGQVLRSTGVAGDEAAWGAVNLANTSAVTGILAISNGGTGASTALGAFNALSPLTTKGDVLTRDNTNNVRLPVGTNGQFLKANSATATGLEWSDVVDGGSY